MSRIPKAPENPLCHDNAVDTLNNVRSVVCFLRRLETLEDPNGEYSAHFAQRLTLARYNIFRMIEEAIEFAEELADQDFKAARKKSLAPDVHT